MGARTLLRARRASRGVSLCILPLRRRTCPGVLAAWARSRSARMAWGVVGAALLVGRGRVAGPPRGVRAVPGVRIGALLGVTPALAARRKGVTGLGAMLARRWSCCVSVRCSQAGAMHTYIIIQCRRILHDRAIPRIARTKPLLLARRFRHVCCSERQAKHLGRPSHAAVDDIQSSLCHQRVPIASPTSVPPYR